MAMAGAATCYLHVSTGSPFQGRTSGKNSLRRNTSKVTGSHYRQLKRVMSLTLPPLPRPEGYVRGFWSTRRTGGVRGNASDSKARTDFVLEGEGQYYSAPCGRECMTRKYEIQNIYIGLSCGVICPLMQTSPTYLLLLHLPKDASKLFWTTI